MMNRILIVILLLTEPLLGVMPGQIIAGGTPLLRDFDRDERYAPVPTVCGIQRGVRWVHTEMRSGVLDGF